ncbi:MAG: hypothetical protein V1926_03710 [Candidatus Peregrinibacteria bacterium]
MILFRRLAASLGFLLVIFPVSAVAVKQTMSNVTILEPLNGSTTDIAIRPDSIFDYLNSGLQMFLNIAVGIVLLWFLLAGTVYVISGGNASQESTAKDHMISAMIGLLLLVFFGAILRFLNSDFFV